MKGETKDWRKSISVPGKYISSCIEFLNILEPFASVWDRPLGRIYIDELCVCLQSKNRWQLYLDHYRGRSKTLYIEMSEIDNLLVMNVIQPAQTKLTWPVIFVSKKHEALCFRIGCKSTSLWLSATCTPFWGLRNAQNASDTLGYSPHLTQI